MTMSESETDEDEYLPDSKLADRPDEYLETQWLPRDEIEPNEWNPNEMEDEDRDMLIRSIRNHGWTRPIVIHAEEHYIIDGEQRWTVAQDEDIQNDPTLTPEDVPAGYVPVFGITVDEDKAKVSTIQHNRATGFVNYESLYDYLEIFQQDNLLDELADEMDFEDDDLLRIVEQESVTERVAKDVDGLNPPWEPRDIREFDESEIDGATRTSGLEESADAMAAGDEDEDSSPDIDRVSAVLSEEEMAKINGVFGEKRTADTVIRYAKFLDENEMIESFQDTVGITPDPDQPHPDLDDD